MKKTGFKTRPKDGWPPFDIEHIWLEESPEGYIVKSFPFFIKNMSFDDIIEFKSDKNGDVNQWQVKTPSQNSTIWVISNDKSVLSMFEGFGCGVEGEPIENYYSINVPSSVDQFKFEKFVDSLQNRQDVEIAFPSWRL